MTRIHPESKPGTKSDPTLPTHTTAPRIDNLYNLTTPFVNHAQDLDQIAREAIIEGERTLGAQPTRAAKILILRAFLIATSAYYLDLDNREQMVNALAIAGLPIVKAYDIPAGISLARDGQMLKVDGVSLYQFLKDGKRITQATAPSYFKLLATIANSEQGFDDSIIRENEIARKTDYYNAVNVGGNAANAITFFGPEDINPDGPENNNTRLKRTRRAVVQKAKELTKFGAHARKTMTDLILDPTNPGFEAFRQAVIPFMEHDSPVVRLKSALVIIGNPISELTKAYRRSVLLTELGIQPKFYKAFGSSIEGIADWMTEGEGEKVLLKSDQIHSLMEDIPEEPQPPTQLMRMARMVSQAGSDKEYKCDPSVTRWAGLKEPFVIKVMPSIENKERVLLVNLVFNRDEPVLLRLTIKLDDPLNFFDWNALPHPNSLPKEANRAKAAAARIIDSVIRNNDLTSREGSTSAETASKRRSGKEHVFLVPSVNFTISSGHSKRRPDGPPTHKVTVITGKKARGAIGRMHQTERSAIKDVLDNLGKYVSQLVKVDGAYSLYVSGRTLQFTKHGTEYRLTGIK